MTLRKYLTFMSICAGICWTLWLLVLTLVNPEKAGFLGYLAFYLSLFLALVGSITIVGFILRARFGGRPVFRQVEISFRQAILISLLAIYFLIFKSLALLRWWNLILFAALLVVLEVFFLTYRKRI